MEKFPKYPPIRNTTLAQNSQRAAKIDTLYATSHCDYVRCQGCLKAGVHCFVSEQYSDCGLCVEHHRQCKWPQVSRLCHALSRRMSLTIELLGAPLSLCTLIHYDFHRRCNSQLMLCTIGGSISPRGSDRGVGHDVLGSSGTPFYYDTTTDTTTPPSPSPSERPVVDPRVSSVVVFHRRWNSLLMLYKIEGSISPKGSSSPRGSDRRLSHDVHGSSGTPYYYDYRVNNLSDYAGPQQPELVPNRLNNLRGGGHC